MNRHFGALLGAVLLASPSLALAQQAPGRYADGTGNSVIDRLNSSQLNDNYKGPYYHRGEAPPAFRPVQLPPEPPPPPPPRPLPRHRHHPHPVHPGYAQPVPPPR
ncbi:MULTISPECIES: hypothetical protein [Asaia]|uniref:hypothetical protein n=1 Tax=Asaia TaxID=91914 RepID=UPI002FC3BC1D